MITILTSSDVTAALEMPACINAVGEAMRSFSAREAVMPVRLTTKVPKLGDHLSMPAAIPSGRALGVKCITIYPDNAARGLPILQGFFVLNDYETGSAVAMMDAAHLTAMRTAAASAVATKFLARDDAESLALIGAGVQARTHLEAMICVRAIREVRVCARTPASAEAFALGALEAHPDVDIKAVGTPDEAIQDADIVCAVSSSRTPVVDRDVVCPGTHINGVGSHGPDVREVDGETMRDARVLVDSRESALRECGDCIIAIADGLFGEDHVQDEIGEVLLGSKHGRSSAEEITVYQSCGLAVQDVAVGRLAYEHALQQRVGTSVQLSS